MRNYNEYENKERRGATAAFVPHKNKNKNPQNMLQISMLATTTTKNTKRIIYKNIFFSSFFSPLLLHLKSTGSVFCGKMKFVDPVKDDAWRYTNLIYVCVWACYTKWWIYKILQKKIKTYDLQWKQTKNTRNSGSCARAYDATTIVFFFKIK